MHTHLKFCNHFGHQQICPTVRSTNCTHLQLSSFHHRASLHLSLGGRVGRLMFIALSFYWRNLKYVCTIVHSIERTSYNVLDYMLDVAILMCHNHSFLKDKRQMNPNEKLLNRTAVCRNNKENHPKSNPVNVSYIFIISVLKLIR